MYEYLAVEVLGAIYFLPNGDAELINDLGMEGWELVCIVQQGPNAIAYFKREVDDADKSD